MYANGAMDRKAGDFSTSQWEALLASMESGQTNVYDAIYGGPGLSLDDTSPAMPGPATSGAVPVGWLEESWETGNFNVGNFEGIAPPRSVLSLSDESLSPAEEMPATDLPLDVNGFDMQNSMMPGQCGADGFMNGPDGHYHII
jgi:hypothetical protein